MGRSGLGASRQQCSSLKILERRFLLAQKTPMSVNELDALVFKTRAAGF